MNKGTVKFYNDLKGFGFIKDDDSSKEYYVNSSGLKENIQENDKVSFDLEEGKKGLNALMLNDHSLKYISILNLVPRHAGFLLHQF